MNGKFVPIKNTLNKIVEIADVAEKGMQEHIRKFYHKSNEECVTHMFYGQLMYGLKEASNNGAIENAFLKDLKAIDIAGSNIIQYQWESIAKSKAKSLIAEVVLHNKRQEGRTGGDFGLIIMRPQLEVSGKKLSIFKGKRRGLLCQAKMRDEEGNWDDFTENQKTILPNYLKFTAVPLYSYDDEKRTIFNPIRWISCRDMKLDDVVNKIKIGPYDDLLNTGKIIQGLGNGVIGTPKDSDINNVIALSSRPFFEVKIYWKNDKDPKGSEFLKIPVKEVKISEPIKISN